VATAVVALRLVAVEGRRHRPAEAEGGQVHPPRAWEHSLLYGTRHDRSRIPRGQTQSPQVQPSLDSPLQIAQRQASSLSSLNS
jgi:hypothetical protein